MKFNIRVKASAVIAAASLALVGIAAGPALAKPAGCPPDVAYAYSAVTPSHIEATGVPYSIGGAGHHLGINLYAGVQVTASISGTATVSASALIAGAQVAVNASLAVTLSASVTYTDTWDVPLNVHEGYLGAGAISDAMHWTRSSYNGACKWLVNASGTLNAPYHMPAFWSWTT
jgi:hypothetical protein